MATATGSVTVAAWNEDTYRDLGNDAKLTKATVTFALDGELAGEAAWDAVMCYRPDGTAVFTGYQLFTGQLGGATGSFVARADGDYAGGAARSHWEIIEGTGTGAFTGLSGSGEFVATATPPGTYTLDYRLG